MPTRRNWRAAVTRRAGEALLGIALLLGGCAHMGQPADHPAPYYGQTLSLAELVKQIDANNSKIPTLWASVELLEADFHDDQKKHRHVILDGSVSYRSPRDLNLHGEKAGLGTMLEVGSNQDDYWFALPQDDEGQSIWTGRYKYLGMPCVQSIPIRPDLLIDVLGVGTINPDLNQTPTPVLRFNHAADAYMVDWVQRSSDSDRWVVAKEVWYDRKTLRPTMVVGFDANGHVALEAHLSKFITVKTSASEDQWPEMASDFQMFFPESKATLHIVLTSPAPKHVLPQCPRSEQPYV